MNIPTSQFLFTAESDFVTFIQIKNHFKTDYAIGNNLFTVATRTDCLSKMYENAAKTPVPALAEMDEILGIRGRRSSDAFICTPILERTRRRLKGNIDIEIGTRMVSERKRQTHYLFMYVRVIYVNIYKYFFTLNSCCGHKSVHLAT